MIRRERPLAALGPCILDRRSLRWNALGCAALVRHEGQVFVYLQKADEKFEREEVKLDLPLKDGWLVRGEISAGDKVVVTGAQQLLSEELKSRSGEE